MRCGRGSEEIGGSSSVLRVTRGAMVHPHLVSWKPSLGTCQSWGVTGLEGTLGLRVAFLWLLSTPQGMKSRARALRRVS